MRTLTDLDGRRWTVHAVDADIGDGAGRHYLPDDFRYGWLVFACEGCKLRLAPIPPGWEQLPEARLREALHRASGSGPGSTGERSPAGAPRADCAAPDQRLTEPRAQPGLTRHDGTATGVRECGA